MLSDIIRSGLVESYMLKTIWTQETAFALRTNKTFEQSETRVKICDSAEFYCLYFSGMSMKCVKTLPELNYASRYYG